MEKLEKYEIPFTPLTPLLFLHSKKKGKVFINFGFSGRWEENSQQVEQDPQTVGSKPNPSSLQKSRWQNSQLLKNHQPQQQHVFLLGISDLQLTALWQKASAVNHTKNSKTVKLIIKAARLYRLLMRWAVQNLLLPVYEPDSARGFGASLPMTKMHLDSRT